jgi:hypothetical protein
VQLVSGSNLTALAAAVVSPVRLAPSVSARSPMHVSPVPVVPLVPDALPLDVPEVDPDVLTVPDDPLVPDVLTAPDVLDVLLAALAVEPLLDPVVPLAVLPEAPLVPDVLLPLQAVNDAATRRRRLRFMWAPGQQPQCARQA